MFNSEQKHWLVKFNIYVFLISDRCDEDKLKGTNEAVLPKFPGFQESLQSRRLLTGFL